MFSRDATSQENPCAPPSQCCATCLFVSGGRACEIGAFVFFRVFCVSAARCFDAVPLVLLVKCSSFVLSSLTPVRLRVWREVGLRERAPCSETDQPPSKHAWNASWPQPCRMRAKRGPEDLSVVGCVQVQLGCLALRGVRAHRGRRVPDAADEGEGLRAPAGLLPRSSPSQPPPKGRLLRTVTFWGLTRASGVSDQSAPASIAPRHRDKRRAHAARGARHLLAPVQRGRAVCRVAQRLSPHTRRPGTSFSSRGGFSLFWAGLAPRLAPLLPLVGA